LGWPKEMAEARLSVALRKNESVDMVLKVVPYIGSIRLS
jgi:hypothetical protein